MSVRRAEGFAVRRWLRLGAASAGMGAALWGLSLAGPQTGVAAADTEGTSSASSSASSSGASGSDSSRSVRSVRTVRSADNPRRTQRASDADERAETAESGDETKDDDGLDAEQPDRDVTQAPAVAGTESVNTAAAEPVSAPAAAPSPTRSWQSPYQRWVARSLEAWSTDSLAWIASLPAPEQTKDQLEASFFAIRRTFFNQAPTIDPVQISGVLDGPVTGTLGGHDPDGDRLIYVLTRGPKSGTVQISRDGTFTYTPGDDFDGVDAFRVTAIDIGFHTNLLEPLRPVGSNPLRSLINQGAIKFSFDYTEGAEHWTPERREALQNSADALILYFRVLNPVVLAYTVRGQDNPDSTTLASAGSSLISTDPGFWDTVVQHKLATGIDANGAAADGRITWNFGSEWGLGESVGAGEYDFQSTAMHELLHSFGFLSLTGEAGNNANEYWSTLDSFLVNEDGDRPINRRFEWDTDFDPILTGQAGKLYFGGRHASAAYGGYVPFYSPNPWEEGSSGSHTDDATFTLDGALLMNARTGTGPGVRELSAIEVGILRDLGYIVVIPVSAGEP